MSLAGALIGSRHRSEDHRNTQILGFWGNMKLQIFGYSNVSFLSLFSWAVLHLFTDESLPPGSPQAITQEENHTYLSIGWGWAGGGQELCRARQAWFHHQHWQRSGTLYRLFLNESLQSQLCSSACPDETLCRWRTLSIFSTTDCQDQLIPEMLHKQRDFSINFTNIRV